MKSVKYLNDLITQTGKNNTEIAKVLAISQGAVSHYRSGRRIMDDETCLAVAIELGIDPMQVVGAACIDRAEKTGQHSLWENFSQRMAATASAILAGVVVIGAVSTATDAKAADLTQMESHHFRQRFRNLRKMLKTQHYAGLLAANQ